MKKAASHKDGSAMGAGRPISAPRFRLIIGAVALLLVVSAGAFALSRGSAETAEAPDIGATMSQGQVAAESDAPGPDAPHAESPQPQATPDPGPSASDAQGAEPPGGTDVDAPAATRDVKLPKDGVELGTVRSAPTRTVSQVKVPDDFAPTRYELTFQPYGWAPESAAGERLVVAIAQWEPRPGVVADVRDLSGQNALLSMESYDGRPLTTGGRYEGTVEVRLSEAGRGTLNLISVKPTR